MAIFFKLLVFYRMFFTAKNSEVLNAESWEVFNRKERKGFFTAKSAEFFLTVKIVEFFLPQRTQRYFTAERAKILPERIRRFLKAKIAEVFLLERTGVF